MLAASLMARGHGMREAIKGSMGKVLFGFDQTSSVEEDIVKFNSGDLEGNVTEVFSNYRELLNLISKLKKA